MTRRAIPFWVAVGVAFLLAVLCFSFVHSGWSIAVYAVLILGVALAYRLSRKGPVSRD